MCVHSQERHGANTKIRGQLSGAGSLLPSQGPRDGTQVLKIGGRHLNPPIHLTDYNTEPKLASNARSSCPCLFSVHHPGQPEHLLLSADS